MSSQWESLAERSQGVYTTDQFESAAYRLVSEQVLYAADLRSRVAYALVEQYEREFRATLAPLGIKVQVNRQLRYACAIPLHAKASVATKEQTLLALVLRKIYDEYARVGEINDDGEVLCDLVELTEKYALSTKLELPTAGRLEDAMRTMKRWGIARAVRDDADVEIDGVDQPFVVAIRPGIADVLGETALQRLALFSEAPSQLGAADIDETAEDPAGDPAS